jgi:dGTPase
LAIRAALTWRDREAVTLSPYAAHAAQSAGRRYPETEHAFRSPYQRDRDRIVHTKAFRRLEYKTQVFVNYEGDHYRTRLTHTIEVSLISRTLSRALGLNEDLAEAIALAHDLGHPPFGHAGESILDDCLKGHGGFEHNAQSLRIVELLEVRYAAFPGLNLTAEVREGLNKHGWFGPEGSGSTLEAQLTDLADAIAYDAHDVDDGLRSRLLRWDDLRDLEIWRHLDSAGLPETPSDDLDATSDVSHHQRIRGLIDYLVSDLYEHTRRVLERRRIETYEDLRSAGPIAGHTREVAAQKRALELFLRQNLYRHPRVEETRVWAEKAIRDLFRAFVESPGLLPEATRRRLGEVPLERVVGDYIAGMTDRFAVREHNRIFPNDRTGSLLELLIVNPIDPDAQAQLNVALGQLPLPFFESLPS